ncbi:histidinol-phosphate transaminase [Candidatus Enterococcus clewellii]|uniref:Histidinol-phosphate aminotransferase n=1 Tax=Candidatus Enterococcus clewellii TaxID=1834193 RepID=A0A242KCG7_9ENTE|nr:histidinol-phosphate transaminase [Enterococcus sp. 9E7_DIV0242]OTP18478.1 histidinol-phosphate transaminase [Enterococcus sp. 9E7_DIV0242]
MKGIRKIAPYVPGVQPNSHNMIKINTNENPYPPSPKVAEALKSFDSNQLKRYSSLDNLSLKMALAEKYGVSPEQLMIGNGSDEVLAFSFLAFFNSEDPILFPDITYGFYKVWADLFHIPFKELPLNEAFEIDLQDYEQLNGGLVIANPNAPTGLFKTVEEIRLFLKKQTDVIVIIDEAYVEFAEDSVLSLLDDHPNLIIVRTLSKSQSLAGLRIGYAIGAPEYIAILESIKSSFNPYSVDTLAEALAAAAVKDHTYYKKITDEICETRDWFSQQLQTLGFESLPSQTNFVLSTHYKLDMEQLYQFLASKNIFVRYFSKPERLNKYLRISIGTKKEMKKVLEAITNYLN